MHHLVFGINFQIHSVSLTFLVLIHLLIHFSTHLCYHPHSRDNNDTVAYSPTVFLCHVLLTHWQCVFPV